MQINYEPSMRAASTSVSLGQMIRDQEMRKVERILNTKTSHRSEVSFSERYRNTPDGAGNTPTPITTKVRSRLLSLLP